MRQRRFLLQNLLSLTRKHDERVWATLDEGCDAACQSASWAVRAERYFRHVRFSVGSITRTTDQRFSQDLVATRLPQLDVASFRLHVLSLWLPGDGPFLFPIDAQATLGLAKSRIFIENKPGFYLRMYKDAKTGLMLINVADVDLLKIRC